MAKSLKQTQFIFKIISILPLFVQAFPINSDTLDSLIAVVGDEPILWSDLKEDVEILSEKKATLETPFKIVGDFKIPLKEILEQRIDKKIIEIQSKEHQTYIDDEELQREIDKFLLSKGIEEKIFQDMLHKQGQSLDKYKQEFRYQLTLQKTLQSVIRPQLTLGEDEVKTLYYQTYAHGKKTKYLLHSLKDENDKIGQPLPLRSLEEFPTEVQSLLKTATSGSLIGPVKIGSTSFLFSFKGLQEVSFDQDHFTSVKEDLQKKLLETKGQEKLKEYIFQQRQKVKIVYLSLLN